MSGVRTWRLPALMAVVVGSILAGLADRQVRAAPTPPAGSSVYLGSAHQTGNSPGNRLVPVYVDRDPASGEPDFWAYCIEHDETRRTDRGAVVGDWSSFVGSNYFASDPVAARKVAWILVNSYPSLTAAELAVASDVDGLTAADAIDATQYAIWRYTDLTWDADWAYENDRVRDLYWYLLDGANAHGGYTEAELAALGGSVAIDGPTSPQVAGTLAGPFVVSTDRPTAVVSVDPALAVTDGAGAPVDLSAVVDGQELFLDLRGETGAGSATLTATIESPGGTGMVVSVDTHLAQRSQSLILVSAAGATAGASATLDWAADQAPEPRIGTTVAVVGSDVKVLPLTGGTVVDRVAYEGLTPGVEHVVTGTIRTAPDGTDTGITASTTFTPTEASGTVEVTFEITAEQVAGLAGRDLVVFEHVTVDGRPIAEHADPTDEDQTFSVEEEDTTTTTSTSTTVPTSTSTTVPASTSTTVPGTTSTTVGASTSTTVPGSTSTTAVSTTTTSGGGATTSTTSGSAVVPGTPAADGGAPGGGAGANRSLSRTGAASEELTRIGALLLLGGAIVLAVRRRSAQA